VIESEPGLRTGQLAARAGVNIQTLRYYERRRLLAPPVRRPSGQRTYPEATVALLRCIKCAQRLGFTLTEIEALY
jgi:MerR family mercuric resistance operon transcriptional regulator